MGETRTDEQPGADLRADVASRPVAQWIWRTQRDDRVRPSHAALDGKTFDEGQKDPSEGEPGDAWGCRCWKEIIPQRATKRAAAVVERTTARAKARALQRNSRTDSMRLRLDASAIEVTPEGYWKITGVAAVGDIVLHYPELGFDEWLPASTLAEACEGLVHKPITIAHEVDYVTPDNFADTAHGFVTRSWMDGECVMFEALVTTADGQQAIRDGKIFLSLSSRVEVDHTPGTSPAGEHFDAIQVRRHHDNLTLTDRPRAGDAAAIRLDGLDAMKRIKVTYNGKQHSIPALMLAGLKEEHAALEAARKSKTRTDEDVAVGKLIVEMADGTKVDLTLPEGQIKDVLAMVGAGSAAESPSESTSDGEMPMAADEAPMDAAASDKKPEDPRTDSIAAQLQRDAERRAAPIFGTRSMLGLDAPAIQAAAIRLVLPDQAGRADAFARAARDPKASPRDRGMAQGRLDAVFDEATKRHAAESNKRTDAARGAPLTVVDAIARLLEPEEGRRDAEEDRLVAARRKMTKDRAERLRGAGR